ncbi:MAG: 2-hydroxychromene-2-carboxylate isomerase [Candidatus Lambdaproteobacteria bacterium]|nr:2-hydroxychromene-2-carboxylate isomerase [Candidatus Lambdaproteobacteria bacterium]
MSQRSVEFYFDYNSPYSYFATHLIEGVCKQYGATLAWEPMVLGGVFKALNVQSPVVNNPAKVANMMNDLNTLSVYHGIPYKERTTFLFNPITALRATLAVPQGAERARAVKALYEGTFVLDLDMGDSAKVQKQLDKAGFDGAALLEKTQDEAIKNQLKTNTSRALERGVFGAPTFFVDGDKMIWGHDRLHILEYFLKS